MIRMLVMAALVGAMHSEESAAQQAPPGKASTVSRIYVGQPLKEVLAVLEVHRVAFHEGGFAFARRNPDLADLGFRLDEEHTQVCVHFSRGKQAVTGISVVFNPSRAASARAYQSWLSASELTLYPDTSYAVHFTKPRTLAEIQAAEANRPKSEYPTSSPK